MPLSLLRHSTLISNFAYSPELQWKAKILPAFISLIMCWEEEGEFPPDPGRQETEPRGMGWLQAVCQPALPNAAGDFRTSITQGCALNL